MVDNSTCIKRELRGFIELISDRIQGSDPSRPAVVRDRASNVFYEWTVYAPVIPTGESVELSKQVKIAFEQALESLTMCSSFDTVDHMAAVIDCEEYLTGRVDLLDSYITGNKREMWKKRFPPGRNGGGPSRAER